MFNVNICFSSFLGPEFPINYAAAASDSAYPYRKSLLVSGGIDINSGTSDKIFEFSCFDATNCKWRVLGQVLDVPRSFHVSFLLFDNQDYDCVEMTNSSKAIIKHNEL